MPAQPTALTSAPRTVPYDGAAPFPGGGDPPLTPGSRPLRVALAVAGSMSFQGEVIAWVAIHRRHHAFTDRRCPSAQDRPQAALPPAGR
jgi:hypothetical protein